MSDTYTQKSVKTPSNRLKDAFGNILFGVILALGGMVLLFWNEGRSIKRIRVIEEGKASLVNIVSGDDMLPQNEGKLVYLSTLATTDEHLVDPLFDVNFDGIALERWVQMYQWSETKDQNTEEDKKGNQTTTTTYSYSKDWYSTQQQSSEFARPTDHQNPSMVFKGETFMAQNVFVGPLKLSSSLVSQIENATIMPATEVKIPEQFQSKVTVVGNEIYLGGEPDNPKVGDLKVWFSTTSPCVVSVIAQQKDGLLQTYYTDNGPLEILKTGEFTSDELFVAEANSNKLLTWGLRAAGWLLVWVGTALVFEIVDILAIFIPFIGNIIRTGVGFIILVMATSVSLLTVAVGWIYYRPLLAYSLIGAAVILCILPILRKRKKA